MSAFGAGANSRSRPIADTPHSVDKRAMTRTILFVVGACLGVLSAIYSAWQPIQAAQIMLTLRLADWRVFALMLPFALAAAASAAGLLWGWKLFRDHRTTAMVIVFLAGAIVPLLTAPVGHAAICSVACRQE